MKQKRMHKILSLFMAAVMLISYVPAVYAVDGTHITATTQKAVEVAQGEQFTLDLSKVFADGEGHTLSYAVSDDGGNQSTANLKGGVYYFTSPFEGEYHPTITAKCGSDQASVKLNITVVEGAISDPMQYGYNETDADEVTVYVTVSSDGIPILGKDETVLSHLKVTVPYFDLQYYDLESFYRYATENGSGGYVGDEVIKRPTAMHLFIYMLERYYLGLPEAECCVGAHNDELFGASRDDEIINMFGEIAYEGTLSPLYYTGGATSTYMQNFWGHDENLMYYRNHRYPLMSPGWGATSDYMLLSDGDAIDLAMFTNWEFYHHGAFLCTGAEDSHSPVETLTVGKGETLHFTGLKYGTQSVVEGGDDMFSAVTEDDDISYFCYDADWIDANEQPYPDENGGYALDTTALQPGTYHIVGFDPYAGTSDACDAPATFDLIVETACKHTETTYTFSDGMAGDFEYREYCNECNTLVFDGTRKFGDVDGNGKVDATDAALTEKHTDGTAIIRDEVALHAADVNRDKTIDELDFCILTAKVQEVTDTLPVQATLKYTANNDGTHVKALAQGETVLYTVDSAEVCTDADDSGVCQFCGAKFNRAPRLLEGVTDVTANVVAGDAYLLKDLQAGKIFADPDGDPLYVVASGPNGSSTTNYYYQRSTDGGETWGSEQSFAGSLFGATTISLTEKEPGEYHYRFYAKDGKGGNSADNGVYWNLTLVVDAQENLTFETTFYVGQDQNFSTNGGKNAAIKVYPSLGTDSATGYAIADHDHPVTFLNSSFAADGSAADGYMDANGKYNQFFAKVKGGWYVVEGYGWNTATGAYDIDLGGMQVKIPADGNVDGASSGGTSLYFGVVSVYANSKKLDGTTYFGADDYTVKLICPLLQCTAKPGTPYKSGNYTYYPHMAYLSGNACLYNYYVYPNDTEAYMFNQGINKAIAATNAVTKLNLSVNTPVNLTVTVPETAKFGLYFQPNNFNTSEQAAVSRWKSNGDGTKTTVYKISKSNANYSWRLTDTTGTYVTKAGWLPGQTANAAMDLDFSGESTDKFSHDFSDLGTTTINRDEGDLQVNLAPTGAKTLVGTQRIRAYRWWELINSDTANIMIEPDVTWKVISGPATVTYAEDACGEITGSQVDGGNSFHNWADINANGGTSLIGVHYDALDVFTDIAASNHGSHGGFYPATNPDRVSFIVVTDQTMGSAVAHVPHNSNGSDSQRSEEWDYIYDTYYYLRGDENATLTFTADGAVKAEYAYATSTSDFQYNITEYTTVTAANGSYRVPLTAFDCADVSYGGTLILRLTDANGKYSYQMVHVAGMAMTVNNLSSGAEEIMRGDQVELSFTGLYRSVNKMAGVFNPTTFNFRYTLNGTEITGTLGQYMRMDKAVLKLDIPTDLADDVTELTLTNGYVFGSMYSASNPFSTIYEMTDTGVGTNFNAVTVSWCMQNFADLTIPISKMPFTAKLNVTDGKDAATGVKITVTKNGETVTPVDGIYSVSYGTFDYDVTANGLIRKFGSFTVSPADAEKAVDGVVTYTIVMERATEKTWDGKTQTAVTAKDGVYEISTGAELAWFAAQVNAKKGTSWKVVLTDDIDLGCNKWTPIGSSSSIQFKGTFDGNGHTVKNLFCDGAGYQGLFGSVGAGGSVKNMALYGMVHSTKTPAGGITAHTNGAATFDNLANFANVSITDLASTAAAAAGGIAGQGAATTIIQNCYNAGAISSCGKNVGGICGGTLACKLTNCFNVGKVTTGSATLTSCGALGSAGTATNSYYLSGTANGTKSLGKAKTAEEMASAEFAAALGSAFTYVSGDSYPIFLWQVKSVAVKDQDGNEQSFTSMEEALEAMDADDCLVILQDLDVNVSVTHDVQIDLNGHEVSGTIDLNGGTLCGIDSSTDGYTEGAGKLTAVVNGDVETMVRTHDLKRYLAVGGEDGYTFNRFYVGVTAISLNPFSGEIGYKGVVGGNENVKTALAEENAIGFIVGAQGYTPVETALDKAEFVTGSAGTVKSLSIKNQLEAVNENPEQASLAVSAKVFIRLADGEVIESAEYSYTLGEMFKLVDNNFAAMGAAAKAGVKKLYDTHTVMESWDLKNIAAYSG